MEEVLWRFPHIGEQIFKNLSNKNLVKCKLVNKSWYHFINNQKFYQQRIYYENLQKNVDGYGETPLHKAAEDGEFLKCKSIIENVDNKNPAENYGLTPLHMAARNSHLDICKLIIENVEDKNPANNNGWTLLHYAARDGHLNVCRLIIENVEDKNPVTKYGRTPRDLAMRFNHIQVIQLFET